MNDPNTAEVLDDLARLLTDLRKFEEAESLAKRALRDQRDGVRRSSLEVSRNLDALGLTYSRAIPLRRVRTALAVACP